ncbi:UDP-glycosyltransferase 91A1-like [Chenopodium quinoa]|uniref:UDP-glycosyltransferase 91A1-like n=1 Tax=Chenopodium quinoa TaxID=63459 RepID=UPI000B770EFD|nr:UDP-glycosyltransferase 91A1-like [Chenopodium quinoa]
MTDSSNLHVVMLPWSAFGHMIPFYELGVALANKGVRVSYISTPRNIERLPSIPSKLGSLIEYVSIPLPTVSDSVLLKGAEATVDIQFDEIPYLKVAYDLLYEPVKKFVSSNSPDWLISDIIGYRMSEVARECNVKFMFFSVYTATTLSFVGPPEYLSGEGQKEVRPTPDSLTTPPPWGGIFPRSVAFRGYEAAGFHAGVYSKNGSGISDGERLAKIIQGCDAVGVRSCREFEGEYMDLFQKLINKPVVPVGLLPPPKVEEKITEETWIENFKWLDQQSPQSVIYVGFGSEYKLTKEEVYGIANGLELAQLPFIWALRKPTWAVDDSEALPEGFLKRTSRKGIVCLGWAPQLKILAHQSIGGSLFHSGWGSIIETLEHEHSLILLPFIIDQGLNARVMVDKGLGIEVKRREDGSYSGDDIAYALRRAMLGDEAQKIKAQTRQAAAIFGNHKLHDEQYISGLVEFLRNAARHQ